ncbi:Mannitol repressor [Flavobacterium sp. CF108]|uniref:MltR family transcriptional regulator n=1 Tax=unclassified Flavobacterium TaxID=196869 RepID=UPI0008D53E44|nr:MULTISPECIES: MltR family transcriptional regulator [unclassified Flavobacterium]SEO20407.1 Mannitol repressor [Flavobacterium sp. fv08]SHG52708.1 Mannitol repressor [Flavobacterium sp. CF108]
MDKEIEEKIINTQKRIAKKMMHPGLPEEVQKSTLDWVVFRSELTKESARGCALLAASHIDFLLEEAMRSKLVGTNKQLQALFDFNGPLGTFSSRILLSYSIGLISKSYVHDLQIIRKIRNEFGHSPSIIDFENPKICALCNNLKLTVDLKRDNKAKFITSVAFITGSLIALSYTGNKFEEKKDGNIEAVKKGSEEFRKELSDFFENSRKESKE